MANWGRRFIAWAIDYIIINIMLAYIRLEDLESQIIPPTLLPHLPGPAPISLWSPLSILTFYTYWALSEWYLGRSMGQLLLNIRLANLHGGKPSLKASAIQALGKSITFPLLPLDCLTGWFYPPCREKRQRFFNKLSNTIVIYAGLQTQKPQHGKYLKEA